MNRFKTAKWWQGVSRGPGGFLLVVLGIQAACGGTNAPPKVPSNRWLVVVQTTSSMAPRVTAAADLTAMLIATGMGGQMVAGDTLGLWTFNDSVHTGIFPLQLWTPANRKAIADRAYDFVKAQKFEKEGHVNYVLYDSQSLIKNSDFITLVLITDGLEDFRGTPFDEKVNRVYQTWRKDQEKAHVPFITALRAEHGQFTNCAVTVAPWPLEMPPPSPELLALRHAQYPPEPAVVTVTNAPVVLPPLIVSGKKQEAAAPPAPAPQAGLTNLESATPPAATEAAPAPVPESTSESAPKPELTSPTPEVVATATPPSSGETPGESPSPAATNAAPLPLASAPKPEPAPPSAAAARTEARPAPVQANPPPAQNTDAVTLADLLSRKNGWIIPLGIAGLVIASFSLGVVFAMFRRLRSPQRISLVAPKPEPEKGEKK